MSNEFKTEFLRKLVKFNRVIYGSLIFVTLFATGGGLNNNLFLMWYYVVASVFFAVFDQIVFANRVKRIDKGKAKFPSILLGIRTYLFILILAIGSVFGVMPHVMFASVYMVLLYILVQDIVFCDVFNSYSNKIRIVSVIGVSSIFLYVIHFRTMVEGVWFAVFGGASVIVIILAYIIYEVYEATIKDLDKRYTKLYFQNSDLMAENDKLVEFREKVEKVNSEINYQKINLTKANDDLEKSNEESRSLIEVMKYFSASFDVEKNVHVMINNIMKVKKAGAVGFYIDKDVYMNDKPYLDVISANDVSGVIMNQDLYDIYNVIKKRRSLEPLVLCENYDFKYPYLAGGNLCNAVAFPAYENDNIYGVMVVASSKYEFFLNGYSFYESSVMDFTSALISDRLYLKTEDMAKKDGLTKIYNRIYFNQFYPELMSQIKSENTSLTVAMMDIDHFKNVNDTYGHLAGDEVIKMVASVDAKYAKLYNGTAVRFGGEEFLLILKDMDIAHAHEILERMHDEITKNIVEFEDLKIPVNVSMGLASYPETCNRVEDVIDRADQALYYSKEHGRGRITIDGREGE